MDIAGWLRSLGLQQYVPAFRDNHIDAELLHELTAEDLVAMGVASVGHRRRLLTAIAAMRENSKSAATGLVPRPDARVPPKALRSDLTPKAKFEPSDGQRRQITVMFVDLVGSTALAVRLDPEDLREIVRAYHKCVTDIVVRHGGFLAKYMGDGVLVYFGYPYAREDETECAVRAGLALVGAIGRLRTISEQVQVRVGIATGLVIVGDLIGTGPAQEREVIGETPNLAARLQALAEPGSVLIAEGTRRLTGGLFNYEDLGATHAKGFAEPVRAFRVLGEGSVDSRFEALRRGSIPLVGREEELELLLRRWDQVNAGEGRVVLLSGEPGIGKSRLTAALQERLEAHPHVRLNYFCSPNHTQSALYPVIRQIERSAGFERDDTPDEKLGKLKALLAPRSSSEDDWALLAELFALPKRDADVTPDLRPQMRSERTLAALVRQIETISKQKPVLMIWEDVHWVDPTSRELLDLLVTSVQHLSILLVVTFRPDLVPSWTGQAHVTTVTLSRLSRRENEALVARVTRGKMLPPELLDQIISRTDGVPLFIEELTKAVLESELVREDDGRYVLTGTLPLLAVPTTLSASLLARLDRLAPLREVAQMGAAIGREFSYELLASVAGKSEDELQDALAQLTRAELVFCRGTAPAATYMFKHALIQDTAYAMLLRGQRQDLHARIATALEKGATAAEPELLAHHWDQAGSTARAVELWRAAGDHALARGANREASGIFQRALAALDGLEQTPELLAQMVDVHRSLYDAFYKFGELHVTRANLVEAEQLAARLNDPTRLCRILVDMTYILASMGDIAAAVGSGQRAVVAASESGDLEARVQSRLMLARALYAKGDYRVAIRQILPVVALLGEDVPRGQLGTGTNQTFNARVWLTLCYVELGEFAESAASVAVARQMSAQVQGRSKPEGAVWLRLAEGRMAILQGDFAGAVSTLEPALPAAEGEFAIFYSRIASSLGVAYARSGRVENGVALLRRAASRAEKIGFLFGFGLLLAQLAEVLLLAGDTENATDAGTRALAAARNFGEQAGEAWALWVLGEIASQVNSPEAEGRYREALQIANRLGMLPLARRCLTSMPSGSAAR